MVDRDVSNFYMILGMAFIFGPILLHVVSLYIRGRNLKAELAMLEDSEV